VLEQLEALKKDSAWKQADQWLIHSELYQLLWWNGRGISSTARYIAWLLISMAG
jgi:hypothetical protein